jgi:hypothetical protein
MCGNGKNNLPSTSSCTGLRRIQHLNKNSSHTQYFPKWFCFKTHIWKMSGKFIYFITFYSKIQSFYKLCQQKYLANTFTQITYLWLKFFFNLSVFTYNIYTSSWSTLTTYNNTYLLIFKHLRCYALESGSCLRLCFRGITLSKLYFKYIKCEIVNR